MTMNRQKRQQIKGSLMSLAALSLPMSTVTGLVSGCTATNAPQSKSSQQHQQLWAQADAIIQSIALTEFVATDFLITDFGAMVGTDCTRAIASAIYACHQAGGGRVVVPQGRWLTGAIHLKSNVNLHLLKNAVLAFSTDPKAYLPFVFTRWEGVELMGYSPLIYAFEQHNIGITGEGILEGGASNSAWWPWKGKWKHTPWALDATTDQQQTRDPLFAMAEAGRPVSERVFNNNFLRPPFIQPYRCSRVLIEGVTIRNSPFWLVNPVLCTDVIVRSVNFVSHGPNSDGCDPESCNRVLIEHCLFDTGDDCIALKSGRNNDGRRLATPIQNVVIQDCMMKAGHGGVVLGSEISGGANHIFARRLRMSSPDLERGLRIKTNSLRGGKIDTVALTDIEIGEVKDAIVINFYYEEGDAGDHLPSVQNIFVSHFHVKKAQRIFEIRGLPRAPVGLVQLTDVTIDQAELGVVALAPQLQLNHVLFNGKPLVPELLRQK
ncbi:MAG: glycoside hydrolase family 28 protein [Gammaproteobacteria bacterium]|nr:glycoside hydrolase family 28 protein [Gammaproteobacteria bacterium]